MSSPSHAIVADIGGTHARFCHVEPDNLQLQDITIYRCANFSTLAEAFCCYRQEYGLSQIKNAALAIACPVLSDVITMTNGHWEFSVREIKKELGLEQLFVLNDFIAIARSLPLLTHLEKIQIGGDRAYPGKPMVVLGSGTGLGMAALISTTKGVLPLSSEGGHSNWAAQTDQEWFIHQCLKTRYGHVSAERLLSGSGLENIYWALLQYHGQKTEDLSAKDIAKKALMGGFPLAWAAVAQFFASLGSFAGDMALAFNAFGGIYIAGGIVPKLLSVINDTDFRKRFEAKGRFEAFNRQIPAFVITAEQPGLLGAAAYLTQILKEES